MIISHKYKFIFIHVPKTGGTSVEKTLAPILGKDDSLVTIDSSFRMTVDPRYPKLTKHSQLLDIKSAVSADIWRSYFKFAFVRNPWDLMVSWYAFRQRDGLQNQEHPDHKLFTGGVSFPKFLQSAKRLLSECQTDYIFDKSNAQALNFVGKFENITHDFRHVCQAIGLESIELPTLNASRHAHYSAYYNENTSKIVEEAFKKTIKHFNYKFNFEQCASTDRAALIKLMDQYSKYHQLVASKNVHAGKIPDFIVAGDVPDGVSALYTNITRHPQVISFGDKAAVIKNREGPDFIENLENGGPANFFYRNTENFNKSASHYARYFVDIPTLLDGERSPGYLEYEENIARMYKCCPSTRILVVLKNPIHKIIDAYKNQTDDKILVDAGALKEFVSTSFQIKRSKSFLKIENLFKYYPRKQVLIVLHERMINKTEQEMLRVYDFLGISTTSELMASIASSFRVGSIGLPMPYASVLEDLEKVFAEDTAKLRCLLSDPISEWH